MDADQRDALLLLTLTPGLGPTLVHRCLELFGSAQETLDAGATQLAAVQGITRRSAQDIRRAIDDLSDGVKLAQEKQLIEKFNVTLLASSDDDYPRTLRHIPDPPPLLYVRGQLQNEDALALAVVGARRCTHYGREQADRLAGLASQAGLCIVSGGAYGIDAAAHRAALRVGGRTLAVLGSGLANPYPTDHIQLFDQIVAAGSAVISELPMAFPPLADNFPRRNRIISGLSLGVLVIEASLRSGALITARLAAEEHHREVLALPGRVDSPASAGCHRMVREGWATLVTSLEDILDALGETGQLLRAPAPAPGPGSGPGSAPGSETGKTTTSQPDAPPLATRNLTPSQKRIVAALHEPMDLDQLSIHTGLPVAVIQADLTILEIRSLITRRSDKFVSRSPRNSADN